jgi:hypothetical protein
MNFMTGLLISLTLLTVWSWSTLAGLGRIGFENLNAGTRTVDVSSPKIEQLVFYIAFVAAVDTSVHMFVVELPTSVMLLTAARKIRASISPYSTAVAALVDRISL